MTISNIAQWSETEAGNIDLNTQPLSENNTYPRHLNNAFRELMVQVAKFTGSDSIASGTTTDLSTVDGQYVNVTGTTTINAFGTVKAGWLKILRYSDTLSVNYNATSMILMGGKSRKTQANDVQFMVSEGSGNWRELAYFPANGVAASMQFTSLTSDGTGADVDTAQNLFGSSEDTLTVNANTTYFVDALYWIARTAGTTSHTTSILFGGTATYTSVLIHASVSQSSGAPGVSSGGNLLLIPAATATAVTGASTSATENVVVRLSGIIRTNAAGTLIPQMQFSAAPGGAPSFKTDSYFRLMPTLVSDSIASAGLWA